jgi:CheY-like chemotaxis protein
MGHEVCEAGNGKAALALLRTKGPFDVLLADIVVPCGMNGIQVARAARRQHPDLTVIHTSGFSGQVEAAALDLDPGAKVLTKPYRCEQLMKEILRVTKSKMSILSDKR